MENFTGKTNLKNDSFISSLLYNIQNTQQYFYIETNYLIWKIQTLLFPYISYKYVSNQIESKTKYSPFDPPTLIYPELFLPLLSCFSYISVVTYFHLFQGYENSSADIAISLLIKNICLIILQGLIIKTYFLFNNNTFIPFMDAVAHSGNKFVILSLCPFFVNFSFLKYVAFVYVIVTNIKNFQNSFTLHQRKNNITDIVLSLIELGANFCILIDL